MNFNKYSLRFMSNMIRSLLINLLINEMTLKSFSITFKYI